MAKAEFDAAVDVKAPPMFEAPAPGVLHTVDASLESYEFSRMVHLLDLPKDRHLVDVTEFLDRHADAPRRVAGTGRHESLASLIAHARAYRDDRSVAFVSPEAGAIQVVYDYYMAGGEGPGRVGMAGWRQHRAEFKIAEHPDFLRWKAYAGQPLSGAEFAELLEDGALQLHDAPAGESQWAAAMRLLAARLNVNWGTPADIISLARTFKVKAETEIVSAQTLASGETEIAFKETHRDGQGGGPIRAPGLFLIAVPIFEGDVAAYRIAVKLRYRLHGASVVWSYQLHDVENLEREAWADLARRFRAGVEAATAGERVDPETGDVIDPEFPPAFPVYIGRGEGPA